ncbi:50S ribosomal protein L14 [Candidatus Woesearchaeota archaeon]|nr:50S ribosomal protein L14 [Candidatus Woesearchaeota archaeon]
MKASKSRITKGLPMGAYVETCDNSGAKVIKIFNVKNLKTVKGRIMSCGVGDLVMAAVKKGRPDMRKQTVLAIIVRQRREYRRPDGTRIKFEDNAAVVVKDEDGNPKGTMLKGVIAQEAVDKWPGIAKLASIVV